MTRRRAEKPLIKQCAEFVIFHLADRTAFAPFTGTDYDAWYAYVPLVRLWGRTRNEAVTAALRAIVHCAQTRNTDVMAVFKKAIPCVLDWSDETALWPKIGPSVELSSVDRDFNATIAPAGLRVVRVMMPCPDGPRICKHPRNKPYKPAVPEPGYSLDQECLDCGAIWREKHVAQGALP